MKSVRIWNFSGPYFPAFGLNTEIYTVNLRIQSEYRKIQTRKAPDKYTSYEWLMKQSDIIGYLG